MYAAIVLYIVGAGASSEIHRAIFPSLAITSQSPLTYFVPGVGAQSEKVTFVYI
jgi:hypothetical protein